MTAPRVRVAVIDSGVHAQHPHVNGVAGGVAFGEAGTAHGDYVDRLGHGTAVAAAIRDLAPDAEIFAVKVFDRTLSARIDAIVRAIEWAARAGMDVANLSLGTPREEHAPLLRAAVDTALARGVIVVAARDDEGITYWPGSLEGVLPVQVDWTCPRGEIRPVRLDGRIVLRASGLPRPIPGVPPERNLRGVSFAVANASGLAARMLAAHGERGLTAVLERWRAAL